MSKKCTTCKCEVENFNKHVKDVWHTYNLRRETVNLAPVSLEIFKAKQDELIVIAQPNMEFRCCSNLYKSRSTYENHLKSKKHAEKGNQLEEAIISDDDASMEDDEECDYEDIVDEDNGEDDVIVEKTVEPLTVADCLLCNHKSCSIDSNLHHLREKHHFILPYEDKITNLSGLMEYIVKLIDEYFVCLTCDKQFYDRLSVRNHMMDLNHMQLNIDLDNNIDVLTEFYGVIPQPLSDLSSDVAEVELPNGKMIGNRLCFKYFKQNLNGLSNTNQLSIMSGVDKAKMSLIHLGRLAKLSKPGLLTPLEKKLQSNVARYRQFRLSRYNNIQHHYRHQILQ